MNASPPTNRDRDRNGPLTPHVYRFAADWWTWFPTRDDGRMDWSALGIELAWNQHGGFYRTERAARSAAERTIATVEEVRRVG